MPFIYRVKDGRIYASLEIHEKKELQPTKPVPPVEITEVKGIKVGDKVKAE